MLLIRFLRWWYIEVIFSVFNMYSLIRDYISYNLGLKLVLDHYDRISMPLWITIIYLPTMVIILIVARILTIILTIIAIFIPPIIITSIIYNLMILIR